MDENSRHLLSQIQAGAPGAAPEIYRRYTDRLVAAARQMLAPRLAARIDPEDVVQSAYRSFFVKAGEGRYEASASGDLWKLLIAITRHKLLHAVEKQQAARRTPTVETRQSEFVDAAPSPAEVAIVADELQQLFMQLTQEERLVLELRLQGNDTPEIAAQLGKSPRTVRRMMADLRHRFLARLGHVESQYASPNTDSKKPDHAGQLDYRSFRLQRLIGAGAFGKVYRAYWRAEDAIVAIKSLRKQLLIDRRAVDSFFREAEILDRLRHPGILRCHGVGRAPGGGYFLATQWHAAGDLGRQSSWTIPQIATAIAQAAHAVAVAHAAGIVHCDLKPGNLLRADDQRIVIGDFGFAVATARGEHRLNTSPIGGTWGYLAPEVLQGQLTPASDIFSLGRILEDLLLRLSGPNEGARALQHLVQRCQAISPGDRPSATQLAHQLDQVC